MSAFQAEERGSIPLSRTREKTELMLGFLVRDRGIERLKKTVRGTVLSAGVEDT